MRNDICSHVHALLRRSRIPHRTISSAIGELVNCDRAKFLALCSDYNQIMLGLFQEKLPEKLEIIRLKPNESQLTLQGVCKSYIPPYLPDHTLLQALCEMDGRELYTQETWAGFMKLKTADAPERPSQSDIREYLQSITGKFTGDLEYINYILPEIKRLGRLLVNDHMTRIWDWDRPVYFPLITHAAANQKTFVNLVSSKSKDGSLRYRLGDFLRYDLRCYTSDGYLRTHEAHVLYDHDPSEFISRLWTGVCNPTQRLLDGLPDEFDSLVPLQRIKVIISNRKPRPIVKPGSQNQSLSYPTAYKLHQILHHWKVQGIYGHDECCNKIQQIIIDGNSSADPNLEFGSIDSKSFTDRFPYEFLQREILRDFVECGYMSSFDLLVTDLVTWGLCDFPQANSIVTFEVGTPLGTPQSFPLATLVHGLVAAYCFEQATGLQLMTKKDLDYLPFSVIGDDFVSYDRRLSREYETTFANLGMELQPTKCCYSPKVAMICSKVITERGIFKQKKLGEESPSEMIKAVESYRYYGPEILDDYDDNIASVIRQLATIPIPLGLGVEPFDETSVYGAIIRDLQPIVKRLDQFDYDLIDEVDWSFINDRKDLTPVITYQVWEGTVHEQLYHLDKVHELVVREIRKEYHDILRDHRLSLSEICDKSQRIIGLYNYISPILVGRYAWPQEFHLVPKSTRNELNLKAVENKQVHIEQTLSDYLTLARRSARIESESINYISKGDEINELCVSRS